MKKVDLLNKMRELKDKNLYFECSDELKRDFDFITEVINIYKDDFDFVDDVAESYVKFIPEEDIEGNPEYIELCMLLGQYVPEGHCRYELYTNRLAGIYNMFLLHVMMVKDEFPDMSELGFSILVEDYQGRKNILNYFASRIMNELYHCNHCGSFEDLIHKHCDNVDNIWIEGYENFFIRNLYGVDAALSYYVFENPHLLNGLIQELDVICNEWNGYEEKLNAKIVSVITEWVQRRKNESTYGNDFNYEQAMNEVIVGMNFSRIFGLDRKKVMSEKSSIISFGVVKFKKDLTALIEKVLFGRLSLTELESFNFEDFGATKKVLEFKNV